MRIAELNRQDTTSTLDDADALLEKAKWRNVVFDKNGKSYRGSVLYPSKHQAAAQVADREAKFKSGTLIELETLDGIVHKRDYRYSIQMPVIEP